jgi:hypothetical protein
MDRKCGSPEMCEILKTFRSEMLKGRELLNGVGVEVVTELQLVTEVVVSGFT